MITTAFQVKIETETQCDRWIIDLKSNLKMIIGENGIAFSYVIRKNDAPELTTQPTWEVGANLGAPHDGTAYVKEKLTVHKIVLRNIADGYDALTYFKAHIHKDDGRLDVKPYTIDAGAVNQLFQMHIGQHQKQKQKRHDI